MMTDTLHHHYDQLTEYERALVDDAMRAVHVTAREWPHCRKLAGDDRAERAADALARWVIESRPA